MTVLETDRLRLRRVTLDDAGFLVRLMNEPAFLRFVGDRGIRSEEDARRYIEEKLLDHYERHGYGMYMVCRKEDGAETGLCGLVNRESMAFVDIGFAFLGEFRARGYGSESAEAIAAYAERELGIHGIVGVTAPDNKASIRILEKLGLRFRRMIRMPGDKIDIMLFGPPDGDSGNQL